jgi:hypothetical protein
VGQLAKLTTDNRVLAYKVQRSLPARVREEVQRHMPHPRNAVANAGLIKLVLRRPE